MPQQDWVIEAANEYHFWSHGDLAVTFRQFFLQQTLYRVALYSASDPTSGFDAPGNIGAGTEEEAIVNFTLPLDRLCLQHALLRLAARQWSWVDDPTTGTQGPTSGINPFEYSVTYRQALPNGT
ncbi:MAG: hypothetical protein M3Y50_04685 [Acidobacteriota bacterium]|nr:hypothetical protein [Acidobacteriota bacterium]